MELYPTANKASQSTIEERNKRNVQIEGVGVGASDATFRFLPVFLARLGATPVQVGLLTSMPGITGLLLSLWVGRFLQGRRNIVPWYSISRLLIFIAFALTGAAPFIVTDNLVIPVILLIWAAATLPQAILAIGFSVVMNAVAGQEGRYELMSRRWSIVGITTAIIVAITGQVLNRIGFHLNYQIVFLGLSVFGLICYYYSSRIKIPDAEPELSTDKVSITTTLKEYRNLIRSSPDFLAFVMKRFLYSFGLVLGAPLLPLYFVRQINASDAWIGLMYTAQTVGFVVGYISWSRLTRRIGSRTVLLITTVCVALYPGLVAISHNQASIFIFSTLLGFFMAGVDLVFFDELMKTVPLRYSPTFVSIAQIFEYLSAILAPLVGTFIAELIGISNALLISAGIRLLGFIFFAWQGRKKTT